MVPVPNTGLRCSPEAGVDWGPCVIGSWRFVCLGLASCTECSRGSHLSYCWGKRCRACKVASLPQSTKKREHDRQTGYTHQITLFVLPTWKLFFLCTFDIQAYQHTQHNQASESRPTCCIHSIIQPTPETQGEPMGRPVRFSSFPLTL